MRDKGNLLFNESLGGYYKQDWNEYFPSIIKLVPSNSFVLDCGCGRGGLLAYLRDSKDCRVIGLDLSDDAIKASKEKFIDIIKLDLDEDKLTGTYDVIILSSVLESLIDPISILKKLKNNLNENGSIIVGVPNFSYIFSRIQYLLGKNVKRYGGSEEDRKIGLFGYDDIQFFNKSILSNVLNKAGYSAMEWSYVPSKGSVSILSKLFLNKPPELFSPFIVVKASKA